MAINFGQGLDYPTAYDSTSGDEGENHPYETSENMDVKMGKLLAKLILPNRGKNIIPNMTDDKGIFQGGKKSRVFGRIRDLFDKEEVPFEDIDWSQYPEGEETLLDDFDIFGGQSDVGNVDNPFNPGFPTISPISPKNISLKTLHDKIGNEEIAKIIARQENSAENPWDYPGPWKNPGNLRDPISGEFRKFKTMDEGRKALLDQLNLYISEFI